MLNNLIVTKQNDLLVAFLQSIIQDDVNIHNEMILCRQDVYLGNITNSMSAVEPDLLEEGEEEEEEGGRGRREHPGILQSNIPSILAHNSSYTDHNLHPVVR